MKTQFTSSFQVLLFMTQTHILWVRIILYFYSDRRIVKYLLEKVHTVWQLYNMHMHTHTHTHKHRNTQAVNHHCLWIELVGLKYIILVIKIADVSWSATIGGLAWLHCESQEVQHKVSLPTCHAMWCLCVTVHDAHTCGWGWVRYAAGKWRGVEEGKKGRKRAKGQLVRGQMKIGKRLSKEWKNDVGKEGWRKRGLSLQVW